jgi:hypothetical protein
MMADAAWRPPAARHRKRDDAEADHRQAHEFKNQRVHGRFPEYKSENCRGRVDGFLKAWDGPRRWWTAG